MRIPILLWLSLTVGLLSCGNSQRMEAPMAEVASDAEVSGEMSAEEEAAPAATIKFTPPVVNAAPADESNSAIPAANRKLVYQATVRMKVADLARANQRMDSLTRALGAFVEGASEEREDTEWRHEMKIRVAPARFPALLSGLGRLGIVESKQLSTDDVTTQHADVTARLASKRALEQRYLELLKKANKVSDMLEIEEKVGEIREEIESTQSRLRTLNDEVSYSTITLTYYQELSQRRPDAPMLSFGSRLLESFYSGWEVLTNLMLGLVAAWPLLLLLTAGILALQTWRRRRARQPK
ncbi:DUF4349 domain-containing protein [Hymenobacter lapidiphilus]|uniref:DUF4349 domain-containing protein n=1 Tax=Hymenobacter sp. CCM 8763 TaxID=2303334 RepID=UPI000E3492AE|nr:DUF4349 domain-containing protein [Hymenobacter sp. CCM 8763]RFP63983.1 DUF4349 domain-containing protein [Hymenobacter sp. CCM 8763]